MSAPTRPAAIEQGWLASLDLAGCELLDEPRWAAGAAAWTFPARLRSDATSEFVPEYTDWLVTLDPAYPAGDVEVYPAPERGLCVTFQHQSQNTPAGPGALRRGGKLCLTVAWHEHRHRDYTLPPHTPEQRLRWTLERAREWLRRAATWTLVAPGEPFELPDFGVQTPAALGRIVVPGARHERDWLARSEIEWGKFHWITSKTDSEASRITLLRENPPSGHEPRFNTWGSFLAAMTGTIRHGSWLWLPSPPIRRPWQAPRTWGELRGWAASRGLDLGPVLAELHSRLRGAGTIVLVGFPVPAEVGGVFTRSAWQALDVPAPAPKQVADRRGRRRAASLDPLADDAPLRWLRTQTWSSDRLAVRGVADPRLAEQRIALIGVGAVGSRLAELLVRAGVRRLHLIDGDSIEAGNLVRHSATLRALGVNKAEVLGRELQAASPFAEITVTNASLPDTPEAAEAALDDADLVIDATAADAVLHTLSRLPGRRTRHWMSISLGLRAARLYCLVASGPRFPLAAFENAYRPWHADDAARHPEPLPWEGAGCWSPVFPARLDDITALVALAVRELERLVLRPPAAPELRVYERECDTDGTVLAVRRCESPGPMTGESSIHRHP